MERLVILLLGKVFLMLAGGLAGWLAGWAPRPSLAVMFRKLPEKKHDASKGGDFLRQSINPSRGRGGSTDIIGANHAVLSNVFPPLDAPKQHGPFPRPLGEITCSCCMYMPCWTSWHGHEACHMNQKRVL